MTGEKNDQFSIKYIWKFILYFLQILHTLGTFTDHIFTKNTERKEEILISLVDFLRLPAAVYSEIAFRFSVKFFFYSKIRIEKG